MHKGTWGCTQAHLIDSAVCLDSKTFKKDLSMAWIDFSKAFDSIPHKYLRWLLKQLNLPSPIRKAFGHLMKRWSITYEMATATGSKIYSNPLKIRSGVLQGDTLSPYLFCLYIAPISDRLSWRIEPYRMLEHEITHTFYMDDLKIYSPNHRALDNSIHIMETLSNKIGLKLNAKKCAELHIFKVVPDGAFRSTADLPIVTAEKPYKYLGIEQRTQTEVGKCFDRLEKAVLDKTLAIYNSQLNARQNIHCYNTMVVPIASFVFQNCQNYAGKLATQISKCRALDCRVRRILYNTKARFLSGNVDRLYIKPEDGGLGLKKLETEFKISKIYAFAYLMLNAACQPAKSVLQRLHKQKLRTIISDSLRILELHNISVTIKDGLTVGDCVCTDPQPTAKMISQKIRSFIQEADKQSWTNTTSGQRILNAPSINSSLSNLWIKKGAISARVLRNIMGLQESKLLNRTNPSCRSETKTCRMHCIERGQGTPNETIVHIVSICPHWRDTLMVRRHNACARVIYNEFCRWAGIKTVHYREKIEPVIDNKNLVLTWDMDIATPVSVKHNRPDILCLDKKSKTAYVCEIAVCWALTGGGLPAMEMRKYSKYAVNSNLPEDHAFPYPAGDNLRDQLNELYQYRVEIIPIIIGAAGEIGQSLPDHLKMLPFGLHRMENIIERLSRAAVEGTNLIICRHLSLE